MQTSVSQRPLTAKKRQLQAAQFDQSNRSYQGHCLASDSIAQRQHAGAAVHPDSLTAAGIISGSGGHMAAASIPAFRTAPNSSQLLQPRSQDRNHPAESDSAGQTMHPPTHAGLLSAQPQSQPQSQSQQMRSTTPEQANLGGAHRGNEGLLMQPRNIAQSIRRSDREVLSYDSGRPSYDRDASSRAGGTLHSIQHQGLDPVHSEYRSMPPQGASVTRLWPPEQQHAAAEQSDELRWTAARDPFKFGQAVVSAESAGQPVMYVKPPWAIDDPYQVACHHMNQMCALMLPL